MEDPDRTGSSPVAGAPSGTGGSVETPSPVPPAASERTDQAGAPAANRKARRRRKRRRGRSPFVQVPVGGPSSPNAAETVVVPAPPASAPQPAPARRYSPLPVYAALDLGTNNCRLLMATPTRPGQFRVVDAFSRIVRLGEGLSSSGRLSEAAMDRAVDALRTCATKLSQHLVVGSRLIATEACRAAANGEEFLARVRAETSLELEIVDRQTEARLAVSGCGSLVEPWAEGVVLFDIGGGSTEVALIDCSAGRTRRLARHIVDWTSLPVGVVSLAERHGGHEVDRDTFETMVGEVRAMLGDFAGRNALAPLTARKGFHLLGTSGTVTTLAGVHLDLPRYDRRRVDGLWLQSADVDAMMDKVTGWSFEERVANPCIGADRADLVIAGCAILEAIRRTWPADRLRVADRGLREGMLMELMSADGAWRRRGQR